MKQHAKKYGALFAFSLITALMVLTVYRNANPDATVTFWGALALGFGWEASVEKLRFPKTDTVKPPQTDPGSRPPVTPPQSPPQQPRAD